MEMLAARFADNDKIKLIAKIQGARLVAAVVAGDLATARRLVTDEGTSLPTTDDVQ